MFRGGAGAMIVSRPLGEGGLQSAPPPGRAEVQQESPTLTASEWVLYSKPYLARTDTLIR